MKDFCRAQAHALSAHTHSFQIVMLALHLLTCLGKKQANELNFAIFACFSYAKAIRNSIYGAYIVH
jgi:hypothetical protein